MKDQPKPMDPVILTDLKYLGFWDGWEVRWSTPSGQTSGVIVGSTRYVLKRLLMWMTPLG